AEESVRAAPVVGFGVPGPGQVGDALRIGEAHDLAAVVGGAVGVAGTADENREVLRERLQVALRGSEIAGVVEGVPADHLPLDGIVVREELVPATDVTREVDPRDDDRLSRPGAANRLHELLAPRRL